MPLGYWMIPGTGSEADYAGLDVEGKIVVVSRGTIPFADKQTVAQQQGAVACVVYNNEGGSLNMDLSASTATIPDCLHNLKGPLLWHATGDEI